jgi:2-polyprenyl-3-methyl-5-hydroxy-6-metoxy-1,4-benzoquinol methylase
MRARYDTPQNKYFKSALIRQYLFKDRDTEYSVYFNCLKYNWYNDIVSQVPRNATVLDINCGHGDLALMLSITSDERKVYAYSASEEEYSIAQNSVLGRKVNFFADLSTIDELPEVDVIIYQAKASELTPEDNILLEKFKKRLSPNGNIVIKYH